MPKALASSGFDGAPVVLQANKQDLPGALGPEDLAARLSFAPDAVIGASAETGDGVRATLLRALDLVRSRVRARLADASPETLPPVIESAEELYASLRRSEDSDAGQGLVDALDTALAQVK